MAKKILLADDSITIQKVVELTFSEGEYEVICVNNGAQAIRKAEEIVPDIALVDVMMPQRNGYEVCAHIKQDPNLSWIPVLLLTGTFEPFDPRRAEQVGAEGHITKPFESRALVAQVEDLLARRPRPRSPEPDLERPAIVPAAASGPMEVVNAGQIFASGGDASRPPSGPPAGPEPVEPSSTATVRIDSRAFFAQIAAGRDVFDQAPPDSEPPPSLGALDMTAEDAETMPTGPLRARAATPADPRAAASSPPAPPRPAAPPQNAEPAQSPAPAYGLSADEARRILERKIEEMAVPMVQESVDRILREVAWEVIPEVAESFVRRRIREIEDEADAGGQEPARAH